MSRNQGPLIPPRSPLVTRGNAPAHPEDLFAALRRPRAPADLKARVLGAARTAAVAPRPALADRLWTNRPLRLAWVAAVAVLLAVHLYLAIPLSPPASAAQQEHHELLPEDPELRYFMQRYGHQEPRSYGRIRPFSGLPAETAMPT